MVTDCIRDRSIPYLVLLSSADCSRTGNLAGRGLGVRARGPVDTELREPSGVRARGEQGSMKACDPAGVISVEPVPTTQLRIWFTLTCSTCTTRCWLTDMHKTTILKHWMYCF